MSTKATKRQPSPKAVKQARRSRLYKEYADQCGYLHVHLANDHRVVFYFGGHEVDFERSEGRITRGQLRTCYLSDDDFAFLFTLAAELMGAIDRDIWHRRQHRKNRWDTFNTKQLPLPL